MRGPFAAAGAALALLAGDAVADRLLWSSGFERGFPGGEWLDWDSGAWSPDGTMPAQRTSAWTIVDRRAGEPVLAGKRAYKGWITGPAAEPHRAYPVLHADIATPLVNTFHVYLDFDETGVSPSDWIHLATWGNRDEAAGTGRWALHTMAVLGGKLAFAHTAPFEGEYIGPSPQPDFPLRRWVRLTAYLLYEGSSGKVQVWQDGVPVLRASVAALRDYPGIRLRTAHWGMYAKGNVRRAVQYNDDIRICALDAPLRDLVREPRCPPP